MAQPKQITQPARGMPLPGVPWRGFTLQIFLTIVVPLVIILVGIVIASQSLHHDAMRQLVGDRDLRAVRAATNSLTHAINDRATELEALSYQVSATAAASADAATLDRMAGIYGFDGGLALFDGQGKLLAHSTGAVPEILDYSRLSAAAVLPVNSAGQVRMAQPVKSADGRWMSLALSQPSPSIRLAGAFTPAAIARSTLMDVATEPDSVYLLSANGDLIYQFGPYDHPFPIAQHPGVPEVLRGESGVNYTQAGPHSSDAHGLLSFLNPRPEHVIAFAPVPPLNWGLVMEEPWEETVPELLNVTQLAPLLLAPILLLSLVALWFGGRQIIEPLQSLERRAQQMAEGNFTAIHSPVGGIDEIRNLQDQMVAMSEALESAQAALHSYIGALTEGLETERRSLARELHDDTLQELIALNQQVQMAMLRAQDPAQRQSFNDLKARVGETIASLRRSIGGLRPIYLEDLGLTAALGMLAREGGGGPDGPQVVFTQKGPERRLPPETELAFYRIAQAALNNAVLHADASQVQILLEMEDERVSLCIADNGRGFQVPADPGAFTHAGHYGLLGMKERADLVGAKLEILSAPGVGTQVVVEKV